MNNNDTLFPIPERIEEKKETNFPFAKPRLKIPVRNQIEMKMGCLDDELPHDHKVRKIWAYVERLDLSQILCTIKSVESNPGAPAIDPKILMALWLYAFVEGIISAKVINRYCKEHAGFKWICGNVSVNEHTISDFRTDHGEAFDDLLTQSVAVLSAQGLVKIETIAQDGMKVEAHAGASSFRREKTLKEHQKEAQERLEFLKKELIENPGAISKRQAAAQKRAAEEEIERTDRAIKELHKLRAQKGAEAKRKSRSFTQKDKADVRASKTDPQARVMKMPNSGFAPAYNVQLATETKMKVIVGVIVTQAGHDYAQLKPMHKQVCARFGYPPKNVLVDSGFLAYEEVTEVAKTSKVYVPSENIKNESNSVLAEIKNRMDTDDGKGMYKDRASTAEFVNARTRTRGLRQFLVAGLAKVQTTVLLFAIGNNMLVWMSKN